MATHSRLFTPERLKNNFPSGPTAILLAAFIVITLSNALLSYFPLPLSTRPWIFWGGVAVPFVLLLFIPLAGRQGEGRVTYPGWMGWIIVSGAVFLRFYRLADLSTWPIVDEGVFGYFATLLEAKWNWQLFHSYSQEPILYTWGQFLAFKLFGNSPASLWLFPAACSMLCVPLTWVATRKAFGPAGGLLAAGWMAVAFWPLYMGRFSVQSILMVLWECLAYWALADYLQTDRGTAKTRKLLLLAVVNGFGFYTYLDWPVVSGMLVLAVLFNPQESRRAGLKAGFFFSLVSSLLALPLASVFAKNYRGYFSHLWSFGSSHRGEGGLSLPLEYFKGLFWGTDGTHFSYGPLWGGLFNPILATLVFLGLALILKTLRKPLSLWMLGSLIIFFLPGFLTNNLEMMRLTALLPLLIAMAALGTGLLLDWIPVSARIPFLILVFSGSTALDSKQLFGIYPDYGLKHPAFYGAHKTLEFEKAYLLLKPIAGESGPGLVLMDFNPDPYDQTLAVAVYSFNAARNPALDPAGARWVGLLTNIHEQPYLKRRFPEGRWAWLSEGLDPMDGGYLLAAIPLIPQNRDELLAWAKADRSLSELTYEVMETGVNPDQGKMLGILDRAYPLFKGDRFLELRYWRIRAIHLAAANRLPEAVEDEEKAISLGFPMAHLYNELGCLLYKENRFVESRQAFQKALGLKPNCTNAAYNLANLSLLKHPSN